MEPAGEGEWHNALNKGVVKCFEDVLADPRRYWEVLLLLAFPENLVCVGGKFQQVIKD